MTFVEAINRIRELQAEVHDAKNERDHFKDMLAPKSHPYGGDNADYFDDVVSRHPLPWTGSIDGMIKDSAGGGFAIFCSEFMRLFLPAINSIVSLRAERDSLKAKVDELERERRKLDTFVRVYDQRRFEAACAAMTAFISLETEPGNVDPAFVARGSKHCADALLAELAKPKEGTT